MFYFILHFYVWVCVSQFRACSLFLFYFPFRTVFLSLTRSPLVGQDKSQRLSQQLAELGDFMTRAYSLVHAADLSLQETEPDLFLRQGSRLRADSAAIKFPSCVPCVSPHLEIHLNLGPILSEISRLGSVTFEDESGVEDAKRTDSMSIVDMRFESLVEKRVGEAAAQVESAQLELSHNLINDNDARYRLRAVSFALGLDWVYVLRPFGPLSALSTTGALNCDEFKNLLRKPAGISSTAFSDLLAQQAFVQIDTDQDGIIYISQLLQWLGAGKQANSTAPSLARPTPILNTDPYTARMCAQAQSDLLDFGSRSPKMAGQVAGGLAGGLSPEKRSELSQEPLRQLRFKCRAACFVAGGEDWIQLFRSWNNGTGSLDFDEFRLAVRRNGKLGSQLLPDSFLEVIFGLIDVNLSGRISEQEFLEWFAEGRLCAQSTTEEGLIGFLQRTAQMQQRQTNAMAIANVSTLWRKLRAATPPGVDWVLICKQLELPNHPKKPSKELSREEFRQLLRKEGRLQPAVFSDELVDLVFEVVDTDGDGLVSFGTFLAFFTEGVLHISAAHWASTELKGSVASNSSELADAVQLRRKVQAAALATSGEIWINFFKVVFQAPQSLVRTYRHTHIYSVYTHASPATVRCCARSLTVRDVGIRWFGIDGCRVA